MVATPFDVERSHLLLHAGLSRRFPQINTVDPFGEGWGFNLGCDAVDPCAGGQYEIRGFAWRNGAIHALPTLGGNNALAFGVANDRGQMVGTAENAVHDPACTAPQVFDWKAVIWGPKPGRIHELPLPPDETVGAATAINDEGRIVGGAGGGPSEPPCGPPAPNVIAHALLWQGGARIDLGNLGGAYDNVPTAINDRGQVVGWSDLPGDTTTHAFLWQDGVMNDLGALPGDVSSFAYGVNNRGQVVGQSCDQSNNCRAFLWQNGMMSDLNTITDVDSPGGPFELVNATGINDRGEIVGGGLDQSTGVGRGWAAVPCSDLTAGGRGCTRGASNVTRSHVPRGVSWAIGRVWLRSLLLLGLRGG